MEDAARKKKRGRIREIGESCTYMHCETAALPPQGKVLDSWPCHGDSRSPDNVTIWSSLLLTAGAIPRGRHGGLQSHTVKPAWMRGGSQGVSESGSLGPRQYRYVANLGSHIRLSVASSLASRIPDHPAAPQQRRLQPCAVLLLLDQLAVSHPPRQCARKVCNATAALASMLTAQTWTVLISQDMRV